MSLTFLTLLHSFTLFSSLLLNVYLSSFFTRSKAELLPAHTPFHRTVNTSVCSTPSTPPCIVHTRKTPSSRRLFPHSHMKCLKSNWYFRGWENPAQWQWRVSLGQIFVLFLFCRLRRDSLETMKTMIIFFKYFLTFSSQYSGLCLSQRLARLVKTKPFGWSNPQHLFCNLFKLSKLAISYNPCCSPSAKPTTVYWFFNLFTVRAHGVCIHFHVNWTKSCGRCLRRTARPRELINSWLNRSHYCVINNGIYAWNTKNTARLNTKLLYCTWNIAFISKFVFWF